MFASAEFTPFDLERMVFGSKSWVFTLEIVVRTVFIYGYALLLLRFLGKRGVGQLTPFDHIIIIALGTSVGDPMFYPGVPLAHAMTTITVVILLQRGLLYVVDRSERVQNFLESQPRRLVDNGLLDLKGMADEHFSRVDLFMALRQAGVEHLGEVKWAFLEPSGQTSVYRLPPGEVRAGLTVLPPYDQRCPDGLPAGDPPPAPGRYACWHCGQTAEAPPFGPLPLCPRCGRGRWLPAHGGPTEGR